MDNFKSWYGEKKGKYILFFGFYLFFFIFLSIYMRSINANKPTEEPVKEEEKIITTYNLSNLINNDYQYHIVVYDMDEEISFNGTKSNVDYANFENKYFLDIYNINQLLKKSKLVGSENLILTYTLENKEINDILLTSQNDGENNISVYVNDQAEVNKIILDLSSYFEKDRYEIVIDYTIGENNEDSSS